MSLKIIYYLQYDMPFMICFSRCCDVHPVGWHQRKYPLAGEKQIREEAFCE